MNGIINHNEKILLKLLGFVIPVKYAIAIKKTIKQNNKIYLSLYLKNIIMFVIIAIAIAPEYHEIPKLVYERLLKKSIKHKNIFRKIGNPISSNLQMIKKEKTESILRIFILFFFFKILP